MSGKIIKNFKAPPREPNEEDASDRQKEHLRQLSKIGERDLQKLGKWQAAALIDELNEFQQAPAEAGSSGMWPIAGLAVVLLAAAFLYPSHIQPYVQPLITKWLPARPGSTPAEPASQPAAQPPSPSKPSSFTVPPFAPAANLPKPDSAPIATLEKLALPARLIAIESFSLLNAAGKETGIPANTVITVVKRAKLGSLTMKINGKDFVGNESRLANKVKLAKP